MKELDWDFELTKMIKKLLENEYYVFGAREVRLLNGGKGAAINFPIAIVYVKHKDNLKKQSAVKEEI
ncbi:hypothetical protein [Paenibacillus gorillae]|uniref:hypothetical protein n=1 Tax=Paenibacillus gorillae TaxID=1243662 RepID=UPI0012DF7762|nr:hypothetical protein [Paenibacillus gorillae]